MRTTNKIIIAMTLIAVMLLGVGYAAIKNITLNITGSASANPNDANFIVKFAETTEVSDEKKVKAAVTDDTNATINVEGLTAAGESVTAKYTIQNISADLSADLSVETRFNNDEYFLVESKLEKTSLKAGEATTLTITVELLKTPITDKETTTIGIQLTAVPVQPGEEGSSGNQGGSSGAITTTLASATGANIGDYIDTGMNVVGTESTADDWRILYSDEEYVYAILADYLPNITGLAEEFGFNTKGTYGVYSEKGKEFMVEMLNYPVDYSPGVKIAAAPSIELLMYSVGASGGDGKIGSNGFTIYDTSPNYDLYIPHTEEYDECIGYWTHNLPAEDTLYYMNTNGGATETDNTSNNIGVRLVLYLSKNFVANKSGNLWTLTGEMEEETTLESVTNENIGDYIDLQNNIVGGEETSDDWRILYADAEKGYVAAILADYLPNSTNYAANAGLDTIGTYGVYSNTNRETLKEGLMSTLNWENLANGINGAIAMGSPLDQLALMAYMSDVGKEPELGIIIDNKIENYDLYVPHPTPVNDCQGFWIIPSELREDSTAFTALISEGLISTFKIGFDYPYLAIRPVVFLPMTTIVKQEGNIWTIPEELTNGKTNGGVEKENTTGEVETTLETVTNANIGEYIDLGNNIVGGEATSDDWRILYADEKEGKVYAILADYLPNSTGYAKNAGLTTKNLNTVYSEISRETLVNAIITASNWSGLANGISGATVTGSPDGDLLVKSYNEKNGTNFEFNTSMNFYETYLYASHMRFNDDSVQYWVTSSELPDTGIHNMWTVDDNGLVDAFTMFNEEEVALRPVVCLSTDTNVVRNGKLWTVVK